MTNATTQDVLTLADMALPEYLDCYSDMFKSIYGFRPRGEWCRTPEFMLGFFNDYDAQIEGILEQERVENEERLAYLRGKHGREFATLFEAENYNTKIAHDRFMEELVREEAEKAKKRAMVQPRSILNAIDAWEHGCAA